MIYLTNDQVFVPITELVSTLQRELLLPVSKADQLLLLQQYGSSLDSEISEIDVQALLMDTGTLYSI